MESRSHGALLITAPTEDERLYEMSVRMAHEELRALVGQELSPWIRVRANIETGDVLIAAGIKVTTAKRAE
jgi:hypothetical protein